MVCLGNICRSPMAEGLMHDKIRKWKLDAAVDSAGFESFHLDDNPDSRAIQVMKAHGINISGHRMRLFRESDFDLFDKIYVMDRYNYQDVISMARNENDLAKVDFILNVLDPGQDNLVPDPYYGGVNGFEKVYALLDRATDAIAEDIKEGTANAS
ncbi:MAG: low molecular weight phosphotyrosine protein phosphatase [Bacteroidetes bacterium]|nr:low molecular weight phosphotyrosine protein phosphatase [Bacteroidota bacterium]